MGGMGVKSEALEGGAGEGGNDERFAWCGEGGAGGKAAGGEWVAIGVLEGGEVIAEGWAARESKILKRVNKEFYIC